MEVLGGESSQGYFKVLAPGPTFHLSILANMRSHSKQ